MLGAGLQFNQNPSDDRFYIPVKSRRNFHNNQKNYQLQRTQSDIINGGVSAGINYRDNHVVSGSRETEHRNEETVEPAALLDFEDEEEEDSSSNIERFLEAITPSVNCHYLSKTTMRGLSTCDVEFQPYFDLSDLWDSYKEWSVYGAGVPLVLNGSDSVVQYYVPYLSAIQLYVDSSKSPVKSRRTSEDSDYFSRDSSSDGSSDSERDRGLAYSRGQQNQQTVLQEGFSSDDGEYRAHQGCLLFEYLEHDQPYGREPLADKISDLALRFPELKSLRSCDLLASSWLSVAWYPIYRIPTGPTLKDLDACFLTYHYLYTPVGDAPSARAPLVTYPSEIDGIPRISLPVSGLASYKFRAPLWTSKSGCERLLLNKLLQAAGNWLRQRQVNHPDYLFFCRSR
ncbi:uncharacterized protein LOC130807858 isoform X1 [Amaranthus tricolor]|uniref:uncharacterized protein LOC130807858 isoform X1 n=1 Tax=Amaranthus tricolor TaxID=29722 RepID=UPI002582DE9A|nr:uncharacterized protein LOC130807858 isoform X1 [Amaranthus tricolor]